MGLERLAPGLLALCVGALCSRLVAEIGGVNHLLVAIALGAIAANVVGVPDRLRPGVETHELWLGSGIVLMGASLTIDTVLEAGPVVLAVVVCAVGLTIGVVEALSRGVFGLTDRLGSLLAAGAGICGVSAVVAVAGAIRAREEHIAYAAATVLLFDAITLVVYPIVGSLLELSGIVFGVWAGVSMFSTGPVVAAGFAHSETAGQWATMTKLSRNALIGAVVLCYASYYAGSRADESLSVHTLWEEFPKFVLGFLALMALASVGAFSSAQEASIENAYNWLFLIAFVGLGSEIRLDELRSTGATPAIVVLLALLVVSSVSLGVLVVVF